MSDLAEFLNARLDKTEFAARDVANSGGYLLMGTRAQEAQALASLMLREVEARRAILALHEVAHTTALPEDPEEHQYCALCGDWWPCGTLRHLAAVYSDHPDYRQEWAPTVTTTDKLKP